VDTKRRIEETIRIGEKNKRTMELVRNWCKHARVRKVGGTGIIEIQTGLPIGHHSLECQHAVAAGFATWDLADAAVDFYDRNCANCKYREPVGFPTISGLVSERDAKRKSDQATHEQARREEAERLAEREARRQNLRVQLDAVSSTVVDQISELDREGSSSMGERLVETARLAPETFTHPIVEHLWSLLEGVGFLRAEPVLNVLYILKIDPRRLCGAAMRCLSRYSALQLAATIVEENIWVHGLRQKCLPT
jgi:hypothetical protein